MPNYVLNKITLDCSDERAKEIMEAVQYDPDPKCPEFETFGSLDFNKLILMPSSLMIDEGSVTDTGIEIYLTAVNPYTKDYGLPKMLKDEFVRVENDLDAEKRYRKYRAWILDKEMQKYIADSSFKKFADIGKQAIDNLINYGATTWYGWSIKNWGTKWNSCDPKRSDDNDHGLQFTTAWSAPHPVINELAKKYPDVRITHEWADEDIGQNCGKCVYKNGECVSAYQPETGKEAIRFAAGLWGYDPEEYYAELDASDYDYTEEEDEEEEEETENNETEDEK